MGKIEELSDLRIESLEITNFLGIKHQVVKLGPDGLVAVGSNGLGKTTIERAIAGAVEGFGADCIHMGAEEGEIILNADKLRIRRRVPAVGKQSVTVTEDEGRTKWNKEVQGNIKLLFGEYINPIEFVHADKKDQIQMVLDVCKAGPLSDADIARWLDDKDGIIAKAFELPDIAGKDGLEAVGILRDVFYDARTTANAEVKKKAAALATAEHNAKAAHEAIPSGATILPVDQAKAKLAAAESERTALITRGKQAEEQAAKMAGTRERIAGLRADADAIDNAENNVPTDHQIELLESDTRRVTERIAELEKAIAVERTELAAIAKTRALYAERIAKHDADVDKMERLRTQANDLEASLTAVAITPVTPEEIAAAEQARSLSETILGWSVLGEQMHAMELLHSNAIEAHAAAKAEADALDKAVKNLTDIAPAELIKRTGGIPGLAITGDGVTLDGKVYANLCGQEQMLFAVDLSKRARAGKVKVLPLDGMEALDEDQRIAFLRTSMDGGWMVIGTLVTGGPLAIIELDTAKEIPEAITPIKTLEKKLAASESK